LCLLIEYMMWLVMVMALMLMLMLLSGLGKILQVLKEVGWE